MVLSSSAVIPVVLAASTFPVVLLSSARRDGVDLDLGMGPSCWLMLDEVVL